MNKNIVVILGTFIVLSLLVWNFGLKEYQRAKLLPATPSSSESIEQKTQTNENSSYTGKILAGTSSPYLEFNQADYQKAKSEGKIIFLDFYANWCPICRAEAPVIQEGFNSITSSNMVGFRVNYNDSDTEEAEKALANEFGVTYQHTKVIIKDGKQILKDLNAWDKETFEQQTQPFVK